MQISEWEEGIIKAVLPRIKDFKQVRLILDAKFYPGHENEKELNGYAKNSLLIALVVPYCRMFFFGRNIGLGHDSVLDDLEQYLKEWLGEMRFGDGWLSKVQEDYKPVTRQYYFNGKKVYFEESSKKNKKQVALCKK